MFDVYNYNIWIIIVVNLIELYFRSAEWYIATLWINMDPIRSSVWVVFNPFLLIDTTDRSKVSSDHHRIRFDVSPHAPFLFFADTTFNFE